MSTPDKKKRKEIKNALREKEAQLWAKHSEEINKRIAAFANSMELKQGDSNDRLHCDALLQKLEAMAARKEITILNGSFNIYGEPVEFLVVSTGLKFSFHYSDMARSGSCGLRAI